MVIPRGLALLALILAGCRASTAPAPPTGGALTGSWMSAPVPSGAYTQFALQSGAGRVAGTGGDWDIRGVKLDSFDLTGFYGETDSALTLSVSYPGGEVGNFVGRWAADSLVGNWTAPAQPVWISAKFYRESGGGWTPIGQPN